jgi:hypothetical protein
MALYNTKEFNIPIEIATNSILTAGLHFPALLLVTDLSDFALRYQAETGSFN